jgi:hypothetical protein
LSNFAFDPDIAPHHGDQSFGDREAQPCPFELTIALIFDLIEFTKDVVDLVVLNPTTGVFKCEVNVAILAVLVGNTGHPDQHMTFAGELDGVAH